MTVAGGIEQDVYASDEMSLRDYWALARRRKWYIIVPVLFAVGFSLAMSLSTTPMYRAKSDVLVEAAPTPGAVQSETAMLERNLNNELLRAEGPTMQAEARKAIGDEPRLSVALAQDKNADLLAFTAESRSARRAADAANAYADTFVARRQADLVSGFEQQLEAEQTKLDDAESVLDGLDPESAAAEDQRQLMADSRATISDLQTAIQLAQQSGATVVNVAEVPVTPFAPRPVRSAILAVLLGLFIGLAAAFLRDFTDNHIRTPDALEKATGRPTSAVIPRLRGWKKSETHVVMLENPTSPQAEAYRSLRAKIQFRRADRQIRSMMITSARPGEGKTTTSTNLAVAFATAGENTVLVDLDMRRPRIHKFFPLQNDHGMSTVLVGGDLDAAIQALPNVPNLSVVPAGPSTADSSEILHDDVLEEVLDRLKQRFDVVVIDTPPVLAVADPLTISHYCDGTLLVVSASGTDKRDAELASNQLAEVEVPVIGAILNNYSASETGYSYSYAYSDYTPADVKSSRKAGVPAVSTSPKKLSRRERRRLGKEPQLAEPTVVESALIIADELPVAPVPSTGSTQDLEVVSFRAPQAAAITEQTKSPVDERVPFDATSEIAATPSPPAGGSLQSAEIPVPLANVPPDESTGPINAPDSSVLDRLALLDRAAVTTNGDHPPADIDDSAEVMTADEFQDYLRDELRRAREEHVGDTKSGDPTVQTIKVVLVAGEDHSEPDTATSEKTSAGERKSTGKKSASKKSAAKKRSTRRRSNS